jgi:hypothetical protein
MIVTMKAENRRIIASLVFMCVAISLCVVSTPFLKPSFDVDIQGLLSYLLGTTLAIIGIFGLTKVLKGHLT